MRGLWLLLVLCACATPPPPKPSRLDPASPDAPEAPLPAASRALVHEAPPAEVAPSGPAPAQTVYTCPMHPEVEQPGPGRCPKCGMNLVPKAAPAEPAPQPHHHHGGSR